MKYPLYLDHNASTPVDPKVLEAMWPVLAEHYGNPASSTHPYGWYAEELVAKAREQVATLIAASPEEIVFTSGATESNNLAIFGSLEGVSAHAISVVSEHRSVLDPLRASSKAQLSLLPVSHEGILSESTYSDALRQDTRLSSVMLANNEIGSIQPVAHLSRMRPAAEFLFHCDATQAAGKLPIDVNELNVDLLSLSAHKIYGPKGIGALYISKRAQGLPLTPQLYGGGHEQGFRSGTLNVPAIVGLGEACRICSENLAQESVRLKSLAKLLFDNLRETLSGIELNGPCLESRLPGNLNIQIPRVNSARLLGILATKLALSSSSACQSSEGKPSHVLEAIGLTVEQQQCSIRIGLGRNTTEEDCDFATKIIAETVRKLLPRNQ